MSTVALHADFTSISNFPDIGFGSDFDALKKSCDELVGKFRNAETLGRLDEVLQSLNEVYEECSEEGWDGYDSLPITEEAYFEAEKLIKSLPVTAFPMPEVTPEPNGEIGLEWYREERQVFIASVSGRNEIVYAGLLGVNKLHGTEYFGGSLPFAILESLKRLYKD